MTNDVKCKLNWTGLEQVTDTVFATALMNTNKTYANVVAIDLTGCIHLTDNGLKWMSMCFTELQEVSIYPCVGWLFEYYSKIITLALK